MINFNDIVNKFKPGQIIDVIVDVAFLVEMYVEEGLLHVTLLFPRNVQRSTDTMVFDQAKASHFQVDKWKDATEKEWREAVLSIEAKNAQA